MMETQDGAELCFPELLNTSCRKPSYPQSEVLLLQILMSSVSVLTVTLNLLVIISVSHFRQLHVPSNLLLLSLAVSDFFVGLVLMPIEILRQTSCWFLGDLVCCLYKLVSFFISYASVGDMVLISIDRNVAVCYPLHYSTRVTVRRTKVYISVCWLCSFIYSIVFTGEDLNQTDRFSFCRGECLVVINSTAGVVDLVVTFIGPISVIVVLYVRVFVVAVSQARAMRSHVTALTHKPSVNVRTKKSELKAARALGVVVVVFLLCLCPYYTVSLAAGDHVSASAASFVLFLYYCNSCLNPVIYVLFYPWFSKAMKLILTLKILQSGSCQIDILYRI
ncbi:trace amine-associated receptor 13c-like [Thalassophryne amazonica]|uniref:trace amine-associated receptor 13c-like n=1 Tax=Thalassophryne amazonica TaxID=390379 RepID=UPI001470D4A4|nr:trace amine-associated receptor 13c-like [Thalassophryne amazonica]